MPWIKFWSKVVCSSGISEEEVFYDWFDEVHSEDDMMDWAEEYVPNYMFGAPRGYKFGYEVIDKLPERVKLRMIKKQEAIIKNANFILDKLNNS